MASNSAIASSRRSPWKCRSTESFLKDRNGEIFHTYSSYGRGNEEVLGTYMYLDLMPVGRNESGPNHNLSDWVRHHDKYAAGGYVDATGGYIALKSEASGCSLAENHS